ncbi:MAG TPA: cupin domain-containing protein [Candidatus Binataceae bacterium]|nr:cupin domain-containing protein [Candidatus Binataceae bacterium]
MATKDFEVQQLLKAYRKGLISDDLFEKQMTEIANGGGADGGLGVENVFAHRGNGEKASAHNMGKTPQSESMVFTIPANFSNDHENSHKGDQIIYVIDGRATARVSGKEQEIKAGDVVTIPAGAMHTLRTGSEPLFGLTIFAPPER